MKKTLFVHPVLSALLLIFSTHSIIQIHADSLAAPLPQVFPSSTPAQVILPSTTALPTQAVTNLPATRFPTLTPEAAALIQLQARESAGDVNVRSDAQGDQLGEIIGSIRFGEVYPVVGRYFRWIQIEFPSSPTGVGWVFDELVEITGDQNLIPDLSQSFTAPTIDPIIAAPTQTIEALLQTPGGLQTATGSARVIEAPNSGSTGVDNAPFVSTLLPTFTYPPALVGQLPTVNPTVDPDVPSSPQPVSSNNQVAPIVPIAILTTAGLLGIALSSLRR